MAKVSLLMQPFGENLAERLVDLLEAERYEHLAIVVAFAKSPGVAQLESAINAFRKRGGSADFYVGCDLDGTSIEALTLLLDLADHLYLVHSNSHQTFHPKIYNFKGPSESTLIVGSHNLTDGGICSNAESCAIVTLSLDDADDAATQQKLDLYLESLKSDNRTLMEITSKEDLERLLSGGLLCCEAQAAPRSTNRAANAIERGTTNEPRLFSGGFGTIRHIRPRNGNPPSTRQPGKAINTEQDGARHSNASCIWIETGAGTGGSNNQLDLSMTAIIAPGSPGNINGDRNATTDGSVTFFGVDPQDINTETHIEIEYEDKVFPQNTIKILKGKGKGKKPNGSWRLYLTGKNDQGRLSASLRQGLANKIALFTRLDEQRFRMELLDLSARPALVKQSSIVAHNGSRTTNRAFGLLGQSFEQR